MWAPHLDTARIGRPGGGARPALSRRDRSAFTLVELVISLTMMSILAVGISSAVVVSLRSVETADSQSARVRLAADVSNQLAAELSGALDVTERSSTAVTFSVPDRNNDGSSEQIRYSWSGTLGDGLLRAFNAETPGVILPGVHLFAVSYDVVPVPVPVTGLDVAIASHHSASDLSSLRLGSSQWASQAFIPELPAGVTSWKPTRVAIYCRSTGTTSGHVTVQACSAWSDGRPGSTVYGQVTMAESELSSSFSWTSFSLPVSSYFAPGSRLAVVVKSTASDSADLRYHTKNVTTTGYVYSITTSAGGSWTIKSGQGLLFEVYGTVVGGSSDTVTEQRLGTVRWELQAGSDSTGRVHGGAQTMNLPE